MHDKFNLLMNNLNINLNIKYIDFKCAIQLVLVNIYIWKPASYKVIEYFHHS